MSKKPIDTTRFDALVILTIHGFVLLASASFLGGIGKLTLLNSFCLGWAVSTVNLVLIWAMWKLVFKKKLVALVVFIIVLKYAFLAILLSKLTSLSWLDPAAFAIGVLSLLGSIVVFSLMRNKLRS